MINFVMKFYLDFLEVYVRTLFGDSHTSWSIMDILAGSDE